MFDTDVVVIGAGIVGLAVSARIGQRYDVILIERHRSFGQETSSRNSEVLHAGIYYPPGTLKAKTCLLGNRLTYQICQSNNLPYKRLGKLIVANSKREISQIYILYENAKKNGVDDVRLIGHREIRKIEPYIKASLAIYSGSSGIVDSHMLMRFFEWKAREGKVQVAYGVEVRDIEKLGSGYRIFVRDVNGEGFSLKSRFVVNCAGLNSDRIAEMVGIDVDKMGYRLSYCKGQYFRIDSKISGYIKRLIYPVVTSEQCSLGIHTTPNLSGIVRLGPDAIYIQRKKVDYTVDEKAKIGFYNDAVRFLPFLTLDSLSPDIAGIRPKLQGPNDGFRDFVIKDENQIGLSGFINLIGIESPGLTSAPAIADLVFSMLM